MRPELHEPHGIHLEALCLRSRGFSFQSDATGYFITAGGTGRSARHGRLSFWIDGINGIEVVLQRPRVVAIIGELKTTGMAQHVGVDRERHLGSLADALDDTVETDGADWSAALGNEYVGVFGVVAA